MEPTQFVLYHFYIFWHRVDRVLMTYLCLRNYVRLYFEPNIERIRSFRVEVCCAAVV